MGTRADFYMGRGESAEWLGSIAFDGFPDSIPENVRSATDRESYIAALAQFLATCDHATLPANGWPWPWSDSRTTDYAYAFEDGHVWASNFGYAWFLAAEKEPEDDDGIKVAVFPTFTKDRMAEVGSLRSGINVVVGREREG